MSSPTRKAKALRPSISSSLVDLVAAYLRRAARECDHPPSSMRAIDDGQQAHIVATTTDKKETSDMPLLRASFGSPYGRKARIAISILGLDGKVKVEPASTQDPTHP